MVQVIHWWMSVASGSGTRCYTGLEGHPIASLTAGRGANPIAAAGTLRNLRVRSRNLTPPGANATISLFVNGSSALTGTLTTSVAEFTDTGSSAVSAGDTIEFRIVSGVSTGAMVLACSVDFEATNDDTSVYAFGNANASITTITQQEALLNGGDWAANSDNTSLVGTDGTVTGYHLKHFTTPGVGTSRTFAVYKNGTVQDGSGGTPDTRLTITDSNFSAANVSFSLSVVAGDKVDIRWHATSGSPANSVVNGTCSFVADTPGCWNGAMSSTLGPDTTDTPPAFHWPLGYSTSAWSSTTEADREFVNGPTPCWLSQMRVEGNEGPGSGGDSWVFTLRKNQNNTNQTGTLTDSATSVGPDTDSVELDDGDLFTIRWEELVTPGSSTGIRMAWQFSEDDPNAPIVSDFNALNIAP